MIFGVAPRLDGPLARKLAVRLPSKYPSFGMRRRLSRRFLTERAILAAKAHREDFRDLLRRRRAPPPPRTALSILKEVAAEHDITLADIRSPCRLQRLVLARQEAAYRIAVETPLSLPSIGKIMCRDHTTALHSIRSYAERNGLPVPTTRGRDAR